MGLYGKVSVGGGGGSFLKLTPDKMTRVRILDYPFVSSQSFEGDDGTTFSTKFSWEVYDYDSGEVKILSKGPSVFNQIKDIVEMQGEEVPAPFDIGIKVTGTGMATRYSVVSAPIKTELPADLKRLDIPHIIKNAIPLSAFAEGKKPKTIDPNDLDIDSGFKDEPLPDFPSDW